jgi:hypothetical protein
MKLLLNGGFLLTAGLCLTLHANPILTLDPVSGAISGQSGQTVGWGFTITNTSDTS